MVEQDDAELQQLFDTGDEPEPEEKLGEGESQPRPVASGEEDKTEAAPEPTADDQGEEDGQERYQELLGRLKRFEPFEPLIEMFEEEPELARKVVAHRYGLRPEPERPAQPAGPSPEQAEQIKQYWQGRFEQDPVGALNDLVRLAVLEQTQGTKQVGIRSLVQNYKSSRRQEDPRFKHYEPMFDAFVKAANQDLIEKDPDNSLGAIENMALGTWVRQQSQKVAEAKGRAPAPRREVPRSLGEGRAAKPVAPAQKKRALTSEEQEIARMYGDEFVTDALSEDDSEETVWGGN